MPRVILTRPVQRLTADNTFTSMLQAEGIEVIELPMVHLDFPQDTRDLDCVLGRLAKKEFDYVLLASPTAVEFFHERITELGHYDAVRETVGFGTVGQKSADKLTSLGYRLELPLPNQNAGAAELLIALRTMNLTGKRVLLLQSQIGIKVMERAFEMVGAKTERVTLYETSGPSLHDSAMIMQLLEVQDGVPVDVIAFFSPSAAESFVKTIQEMGVDHLYKLPTLAAIGETTAFEIGMRLRRRPEIVARKSNQESLAQDIIAYIKENTTNV
ncbi:MAG TPA: uroporphyrinogen-III synthase [Candidatus Kapabacteria bacterium]